MKKVFAEAGLGNSSFFSTEYEEGGKEYRIPKFIRPKTIHGYYFRFWFFKRVFVFSTNDGFETSLKNKNRFKILFGISGSD